MTLHTPLGVQAPSQPRSLSETGIAPVMMHNILLKTMFRMNLDLVSDLARAIALPVNLTQELIDAARGHAAIEGIRATEEGFAFGGSGTLYGTPRATFYEVPRGPLQSIAQFRHANLAG